jgi:hypothetical protein
MTTLLEHTRANDMYRQVFVPSRQNNVVTIPSNLYGQTIEVIVLPAFVAGAKSKQVRRGWAVSAQQMHLAADDKLLIPTELKNENTDWWQWEE